MAVKYQFPADFWWGAATSGPQSEGRFHKAHRNVFDYWYDTDPQAFFNGVGPNVASNFYNDYVQDIALMKEIGLNSVRTSIQWTRLMQVFEAGTVDADGVRFYNAPESVFAGQIGDYSKLKVQVAPALARDGYLTAPGSLQRGLCAW